MTENNGKSAHGNGKKAECETKGQATSEPVDKATREQTRGRARELSCWLKSEENWLQK